MIKNLKNILRTLSKTKTNYKEKIEIYNKIIEEINIFLNKISEKNSYKYIFISDNDEKVRDSLINLTILNKIGEGDTKEVFDCNYNSIVIKKDKYSFMKTCYLEFLFWLIIKETSNKKYFAPCIGISKNFDELIMKKIEKPNKNLINTSTHKKIKNLCNLLGYNEINDIERNYGVLNNNLVLCDYSISIQYNNDFFEFITQENN
jgi:hypothetical protein